MISAGAAVYSSELLLNGIVIQRLEYERLVCSFARVGKFITGALEI